MRTASSVFLQADHLGVVDTAKDLTRTRQDALKAIAFYHRQKEISGSWLVGNKRLSEKIVDRLERLYLVEESFLRGEPILQLTMIGQAFQAHLLH